MDGMNEYLSWRGDLTFAQAPPCEVDALIFAVLSYLDMGREVTGETGLTLAEIAAVIPPAPPGLLHLPEQQRALLIAAAGTERFRAVRVHRAADILDNARAMQFSAVTFELPGIDTACAAFRGTDGSVAGWHEDFRMAYESPVPAQQAAADYLAAAARRTNGRLICCGHSKGGNLAFWAASHLPEAAREKLDAAYNFDGPGADEETLRSEGWLAVLPKMRTFVPQGSVVGLLLSTDDNYRVIHAASVSLFQHDPFMWEVRGSGFVPAEELTFSADVTSAALHEWLRHSPPDKRRTFVEALFRVLRLTGADQLTDLTAAGLILAARSLTAEERGAIQAFAAEVLAYGASSTLEAVKGKPLAVFAALTGAIRDLQSAALPPSAPPQDTKRPEESVHPQPDDKGAQPHAR